jgi:hypothetical protein
MLNLLVNSTRGINPFGRHFHTPHAVNRFRRGPYQTLHNADGTLAVDMFWYEPRWQHDFETVKFQDSADNWKKVLCDAWSKFQRNPLTLHPLCSPITKIHAAVAATPETLDLLSRKKTGDRLMISGRFVERFGGKAGAIPGDPVSAEEFEGSFTE